MLEPFLRGRPTGLRIEGAVGGVRLTWDSYPGALCYSVYKAVDELDPYGAYIVVAECTENTDIVLPFAGGCFVVTAITAEGESDYSDPACYSPGSVFPASIILVRSLGNNPSTFGDLLTFQATVTGNIPTGSVTFYDGITPLGSVLLDGFFQASISTNGLSVGIHSIAAEYTGDGNNSPCDSNLVSQIVVVAPGDPCDPDPWEDLGAVPTSFGMEEFLYNVNIPAPVPHLNFADPYTPTHTNLPAPWPAGTGWDIDISYVSGDWTANNGGNFRYGGWGLTSFRNGSVYGMRLADCALINANEAAAQAVMGPYAFSFLETTLLPGQTYGIGINLRNTSWGDGMLGSTDMADPYYDPSLLCSSNNFSTLNSGTIFSNLVLRARIWRDTTAPFVQARIRNWATVKTTFANPPANVAGPFGPNTFSFVAAGGNEWNGILACSTTGASDWWLDIDGCLGYPVDFLKSLNGYSNNFDVDCLWQASYYDSSGTLINSPAWILMVVIRDNTWDAEFQWWVGIKLHGSTPEGTYWVCSQDPYNACPPGQPWNNQYQTALFAPGVSCLKVDRI